MILIKDSVIISLFAHSIFHFPGTEIKSLSRLFRNYDHGLPGIDINKGSCNAHDEFDVSARLECL